MNLYCVFQTGNIKEYPYSTICDAQVRHIYEGYSLCLPHYRQAVSGVKVSVWHTKLPGHYQRD